MKTINITIQIPEYEVTPLSEWLREYVKVIDFKILPDTKELYEKDKTFQKLVKAQKDARKVCDNYINEHNF